MKTLFEANPSLDRAAPSKRFANTGRVRVRDVLTPQSAREVLGTQLPRGSDAGAGEAKPRSFRAEEARTPNGQKAVNAAASKAQQHAARGEYGFRFAHYPIFTAIQEGWDPGSRHEILLEHLKAPDFLELARAVTGIEDLMKADGQATLFAPNHDLGRHIDSHVAEGRKVACVPPFAPIGRMAVTGWLHTK